MASISTEKGTKILYYELNGTKKITLGQITQRSALQIKCYVEDLINSKITGISYSQETANWLSKVEEKLYKRLVKKDLVQQRAVKIDLTIQEFINSYIDSRKELASNTIRNMKSCRDKFFSRFGKTRKVSSITKDEADTFFTYLQTSGGSPNTYYKVIKVLKHYFEVAVDRNICNSNPFKHIPCPDAVNEDRMFEITREMFFKIIEHCPDVEFQFLIACYRILGTRYGEPFYLKVGSVNWAKNEIEVLSPKTARKGKSKRFVPIYPEFRPFLERLLQQRSKSPETPLIIKWRKKPAIIRKHYIRVLKSAGIPLYERLFQNHRSSRISEQLLSGFTIKAIATWSGNSPEIILKHYAKLNKQEIDRAGNEPTGYTPPTGLRLVM